MYTRIQTYFNENKWIMGEQAMWLSKNSKIFLGILVAGSILFGGCGILPKEEQTLAPPLVKPQKQEYQVFEVKKKDITKQVKGNGSLASINESNLFTKDNGRRIKSVNVQFGQTVKKGDVLIELDSDNLENDVKIEKYNLQRAQINYERAVQGTDEYAKKLAAIEVNVETTKLEAVQKQLAASRLTAPVDGQVTFVETIKPGDSVEAYKPLVTVADPAKLQVVYQTSDANSVQTGMRVNLNLKGQNYEGVVAQIPTSGKLKGSIIVNFKDTPKDATLGDGVELAITLETKKNTIVIPKTAVKNFMGNNMVEVLDGSKKISIDVEKGIETSTEVEILSGLTEGQKVILN